MPDLGKVRLPTLAVKTVSHVAAGVKRLPLSRPSFPDDATLSKAKLGIKRKAGVNTVNTTGVVDLSGLVGAKGLLASAAVESAEDGSSISPPAKKIKQSVNKAIQHLMK